MLSAANSVFTSSGLSRKNFDLLLRRIDEMRQNPNEMAGVAVVAFAEDVHASMLKLGISERDLAARSGLSLRKIKAVLEPPIKVGTRVTDLAKIAKALGAEIDIRLRKN